MATQPAELVFDPFLGSGMTAITCLASGLQFLAYDVDAGTVSLFLERIAAYEWGKLKVGDPTVEIVRDRGKQSDKRRGIRGSPDIA
jgi:tRNA G10  N-methylase Trm11